VVQLLLGAGAAVDASTADGETPLLYAAGQGHTEVVRLLLGAGADPQPSSLAAAVQRGHHKIAQLLRDAGAAD
jgi:ankyrin repeat protein